MHIDQLLEAGLLAQDHVIGEQDGAGLLVDQPPRRPDRVAEAQRPLLLDVGQVQLLAELVDLPEHGQQVVLPALGQVELELEGAVEMVDDRPLPAAGDQDDLLDPGSDRLLDAVLDGRLVDQG